MSFLFQKAKRPLTGGTTYGGGRPNSDLARVWENPGSPQIVAASQWFAANGKIWFNNHTANMERPLPGDVVFFQWVGTHDYHIAVVDHVLPNGIVYVDQGNDINGGVSQWHFSVDDPNVRAYGSIFKDNGPAPAPPARPSGKKPSPPTTPPPAGSTGSGSIVLPPAPASNASFNASLADAALPTSAPGSTGAARSPNPNVAVTSGLPDFGSPNGSPSAAAGPSSSPSPRGREAAPPRGNPFEGVSNNNINVFGRPTITAAQIESILRAAHSPAAGTGQQLYNIVAKYGINPAYALAAFHHESTYATAPDAAAIPNKSLGNVRCYEGCVSGAGGFAKYNTWADSYLAWAQLIAGPVYRGSGLTTLGEIIPKYAPPSDSNDDVAYIALVGNDMRRWEAGHITPF
jgi:hypothetical protein